MEEVEKYYQLRAEEFIDSLFDKGYFREDVKRKDMRDVESLLGFLFQSQSRSAVKCSELLRKISILEVGKE